MKAPIKELEILKKLSEEARIHISSSRHHEAEDCLRQALAIDDRFIPALELMAALYESRGDEAKGETWRKRVKAVRLEQWERQVEAEARGRHEMMGEAVRHEIP